MNKRFQYIDIARAIAICFIVFGHTIVHNSEIYFLYKYIYSFHVILFFIISGYVYSNHKSVKDFCFLKFRKLLIPYFVFSVLFLIPFFLFGNEVAANMDIDKDFNIKSFLFEILYGVGYNGALKQNTSLWFLPALFSTEVMYVFVQSRMEKFYIKHKDFILTIFCLIIAYVSTYVTVIFPMGVNSALTLLFFFQVGVLLKKYNALEYVSSKRFTKFTIIGAFILSIFLYRENITVSCADYRYGIFPIFLFVSISISIFICLLSRKINQCRVLEYIGRNTLGILIFHKLFIVLFQTKIQITADLINHREPSIAILTSIVVTAVTISICLVINQIINKYIPFLYGERCVKNESQNLLS